MELDPVLLTLVATNNRLTEMVKFWLNAPSLPVNPSSEVKRLIVLFASLLIGVVSVFVMPESTAWAGEMASRYPYPVIFVTGFMVSFGGAALQPFFEVFGALGKSLAPKANTVIKTSTGSTTVSFSASASDPKEGNDTPSPLA